MSSTRTERIAWGGSSLTAQVPEGTRIVTAKTPRPGVREIEKAVREAIGNPIRHEPLPRLVGAGTKVAIAFDDASGAYFQTKRTGFRRVAIEVLVEELRQAGVELSDISLLCAQGAEQDRNGNLPR